MKTPDEIIQINLLLPTGEMMPVELKFWEESPETQNEARLELEFEGRLYAVSPEEGVFDAFRQLRLQLEEFHVLPVCFGASLNVYPSPMSLQMGGGWQAYRFTLGRQALLKDLVSIFDTDETVEPVTVKEQEAFYDRWLDSLSEKS